MKENNLDNQPRSQECTDIFLKEKYPMLSSIEWTDLEIDLLEFLFNAGEGILFSGKEISSAIVCARVYVNVAVKSINSKYSDRAEECYCPKEDIISIRGGSKGGYCLGKIPTIRISDVSFLTYEQAQLYAFAKRIEWSPNEEALLSDFLTYSGQYWTKKEICDRTGIAEKSLTTVLFFIKKKLKKSQYKGVIPEGAHGTLKGYSFGNDILGSSMSQNISKSVDDVCEEWKITSPDILDFFKKFDWKKDKDSVEGVLAYLDYYREYDCTIQDIEAEVVFKNKNVDVVGIIQWINQGSSEYYEKDLIIESENGYSLLNALTKAVL